MVRVKQPMRGVVWVLATTPFLLLAAWHWSEGPGISAGDYAHHLLHARALAEGNAYTDNGYIFSEYNWVLGPRAQPPGLPLTLTPILALFGYQLWLIKALMLAFALTFVVVAGRYFAEHEQRLLGVGVAFLVGLSPALVSGSTQINTDLPFAALLWIVIYLYDRPGTWGYRRIAAIAALGGAAMLFRIVGVVIFPAALAYGIFRFREHRYKGLAPVAIWSAAGLIGLLVIPTALDALGGLALDAVSATFTNPLGIFREKLLRYRTGVFASHLYPLPGDTANDVYHGLSLLVMALGLIAWLLRARRSFLLWFAVVYIAMLLIVPMSGVRYLWPLFPLSAYGLLNGVRVLCRAVRGSWVAERAEATTVGVALVLALLSVTIGPKEPRRESLAEQPDVRELIGWLTEERSTLEEMRVVFVKPRVLAWETRIPSMGMFVVPGIEQEAAPGCVPTRTLWLDHLRQKRITHVVEGDFGLARKEQRVLAALVEACSDDFTLQFSNPSFRVYRFQPENTGTSAAQDRQAARRRGDERVRVTARPTPPESAAHFVRLTSPPRPRILARTRWRAAPGHARRRPERAGSARVGGAARRAGPRRG